MTDITEQDLNAVFTSIAERSRQELVNMKQEDLEKFWFYDEYVESATPAWNLYVFMDMLDVYRRKCRQWEEMHNGSMCVVERVRDTYLMPKIKEFTEKLKAA